MKKLYQMGIIRVFIILFIITSCQNKRSSTFLSVGDEEEITEYFEADSIYIITDHENNTYTLQVKNSRINNDFILNLASRVAALRLHDALVSREREVDYNTKFLVKHDPSKELDVSYELTYLADISNGMALIEKTINKLKKNQSPKEYFLILKDCNEDLLVNSEVNWSKTEHLNLIGFEEADFIACGDTLTTTLYRILLSPIDENIWIYYSLESDKLLAIIRRPEQE